MRSLSILVVLLATVYLVGATAPLLAVGLEASVPDEYIVVFHQNVTLEHRDAHIHHLRGSLSTFSGIKHVYDIGTTFKAYAAVLGKDDLAKELENPMVAYVEANQRCGVNADPSVVQTGLGAGGWGLDRISKAALPLDQTYRYFSSAGGGVYAYVIDTGVLHTHGEFEGRASFGISYTGETTPDGNGHGTHVAGTIGGKTWGVAKKVTIVGVQVLNAGGSGTYDGVLAGIQWATKEHTARGAKARSVANLSLGGPVSQAVDDGVIASVAAGVVQVIAAGNSNANACNYSPARAAPAITVGSTQNNDARSSFSNIGACVDIFAPGTNIQSAWIGSNTATSTISGTSMAAPHVAGAAAVYLGHAATEDANVVPNPAAVLAYLTRSGTAGKITTPGTGSPNLLLYSPYAV